jgi:hypothetical protein
MAPPPDHSELTPSGPMVPNPHSNPNEVKPTHKPTLSGLQQEVNGLQVLVQNLVDGQQELRQESLLIQGWFDVLRPLKEQMMVEILAFQAQMQGLRDAMELDKMKSEMKRLRKELGQASIRIAQLEEVDTSEEGEVEEGEENKQDERCQPKTGNGLKFNLPNSSMFVHPAQLQDKTPPSPPLPTGPRNVPEIPNHTDDDVTGTGCTNLTLPTADLSTPADGTFTMSPPTSPMTGQSA